MRNTDIVNTTDQQAKKKDEPVLNELEEKAKFERRIGMFKEFCCQKLDPFFDHHGLEFCDPDEDVEISDGAESEFDYEYPSGYDSKDPNNPEYIQVLSSGNESDGEDEY